MIEKKQVCSGLVTGFCQQNDVGPTSKEEKDEPVCSYQF